MGILLKNSPVVPSVCGPECRRAALHSGLQAVVEDVVYIDLKSDDREVEEYVATLPAFARETESPRSCDPRSQDKGKSCGYPRWHTWRICIRAVANRRLAKPRSGKQQREGRPIRPRRGKDFNLPVQRNAKSCDPRGLASTIVAEASAGQPGAWRCDTGRLCHARPAAACARYRYPGP